MKLNILVAFWLLFLSTTLLAEGDHGHDHSSEPAKPSAKTSKDDQAKNSGHNHGKHKDEKRGEHEHDAEEESHKEAEHSHEEGEAHAGGEEHGDHDEHGSSGVGAGKAIVEVKYEGESFRLSQESETFLGIQTKRLKGMSPRFQIPSSSLVEYQEKQGVFTKSGTWFSLRSVKVISEDANSVTIESESLNETSLVVTAGTGHLRAAHLQASGQGGKGHAH